MSGTRFAGAGSLWPDPFPPSPPPPSIGLCSETSPVLWVCPTSRVRSSSAFVLGLPDAARFLLLLGQTRDLPVPVPSVSLRARVCDLAGFLNASRWRRPGCCLPHTARASASRSNYFRGSIARPVLPPVNASASPSRASPHDSGSVWFATPSLCDSCIHYAKPVSRRFRLHNFAPSQKRTGLVHRRFGHLDSLK